MHSRLSRSLRPFADSRFRVRPLGIGVAALGRPGYINLGHGEGYQDGLTVGAMEQRAFEVLDVSRKAGRCNALLGPRRGREQGIQKPARQWAEEPRDQRA
jgi:hypothetical protein